MSEFKLKWFRIECLNDVDDTVTVTCPVCKKQMDIPATENGACVCKWCDEVGYASLVEEVPSFLHQELLDVSVMPVAKSVNFSDVAQCIQGNDLKHLGVFIVEARRHDTCSFDKTLKRIILKLSDEFYMQAYEHENCYEVFCNLIDDHAYMFSYDSIVSYRGGFKIQDVCVLYRYHDNEQEFIVRDRVPGRVNDLAQAFITGKVVSYVGRDYSPAEEEIITVQFFDNSKFSVYSSHPDFNICRRLMRGDTLGFQFGIVSQSDDNSIEYHDVKLLIEYFKEVDHG